MKWEPVAAMIAVLLLGVWLVYGQGGYKRPDMRPGAQSAPIRMPAQRGWIEFLEEPAGQWTFRAMYRGDTAGELLGEAEARRAFGDEVIDGLISSGATPIAFRLFNITTWGSLLWIMVGFGGQIAFSGRMLVQWFVSEKKKQSVVPEAFWWMSLAGGVCLFTYFVWRQDLVGVLGQSSGLVIYARNLRLISKHRRREARAMARASAASTQPSPPERGDA